MKADASSMVEAILQRVEAVLERVREKDGRKSAAVLKWRTPLSFGGRRAETERAICTCFGRIQVSTYGHHTVVEQCFDSISIEDS
jgi:hypothetical protein